MNQALYFSIFKKQEDLSSWGKLIMYAQQQSELSKELTQNWIKALEFLRKNLGESFLTQVGHQHQFANLIMTTGDWQVKRLLQYVDVMQYLRNDDLTYAHLLKKIISPRIAKQEGMYFLQIGHLLQSAELDFHFPPEINRQRNPDIKIVDSHTHQVIFGEVSRMEDRKSFKEIDRNYRLLQSVLDQQMSNPLYSAVQFKLIPKEYLTTLIAHLIELQEKVSRTNVAEKHEDSYISINLFPVSKPDALNSWMTENNRRKGLTGLPLSLDDTDRISGNKIDRKSKQLPKDGVGIIFIPVSPLHFWQQQVTSTMDAIQFRLQDQPHVFGVFLFAEILHGNAQQFHFNNDDGFIRKSLSGPLTMYSLFIPNNHFKQQFNPDSQRKILKVLSGTSLE